MKIGGIEIVRNIYLSSARIRNSINSISRSFVTREKNAAETSNFLPTILAYFTAPLSRNTSSWGIRHVAALHQSCGHKGDVLPFKLSEVYSAVILKGSVALTGKHYSTWHRLSITCIRRMHFACGSRTSDGIIVGIVR